MTSLITGGAGFIGSNLAHALVDAGENIRILDDLSNGSLTNLPQDNEKITFIEGSITDSRIIEDAIKGCKWIFHQAAEISVPDSILHPQKTHQTNVEGTLNVLEAARKHDVGRVVLASSAAVYGDNPALPKTEESSLDPQSPYAESKIQNEADAKRYFQEYGLETICLRYFNVYGPNQNPTSQYSGVISKFMECALKTTPPTVYGSGEQTRDFVFVDDVVSANILAANKKKAAGEIFNIATGTEISILDLWHEISRIANCDESISFAPRREGDILQSIASIEKAKHILGYSPQCSLTEGLKKTMEWMKHGNA